MISFDMPSDNESDYSYPESDNSRRIVFDTVEDSDDEFGSIINKNVRVVDAKADTISDKIALALTDEDILDSDNFTMVFSGLNQHRTDQYFSEVHDNAKEGRFKKDYFVPFPTSSRQSEYELMHELKTGSEQTRPFALLMQSSETFMPVSDLEKIGMALPENFRSERIKGSYDFSTAYKTYLDYAEHMSSEDSVDGNISYLYETSETTPHLREHELNSISCYKPILEILSRTVLHSYSLFLRRLAENIMHSSKSVKRKMIQVRTLGDGRILSLQTHSSLSNIESGPLCAFIIKMCDKDYEIYSKYQKLKVLFQNDKNETYVFVPWQSFDLTDCTIMLRSNYNLLVFPQFFTDGLDDDHYSKVKKCLTLLTALIQCRNSQVFDILSSFRYIMPGILNDMHNISELIYDKFPRDITSPFNDYILVELFDWLMIVKQSLIIKNRAKTIGNVPIQDEYDVEFSCDLPFLNFRATNFQQYLSITYLVSMSVGKTSQSRHVQLELAQTLIDWEDKAQNYNADEFNDDFDFNHRLVEMSANFLVESVELSDGQSEDLITKFLRTKGTISDNGREYFKLFDRVLYDIDHPIYDCKTSSLILKSKPKPIMRMAVRDDHAGKREIFVTSLPAVAALNVIESVAHGICEQLPSEHITLGGDQKVLVMQREAQSSLDFQEYGWTNFLGSEDASKWSTGDNPDIIELIWSKISKNVDPDLVLVLSEYIKSLKERTVLLQDNIKDYVKKRTGKDQIDLTMGWPQGFFNKISSLKHYLCYCLALAMFKRKYTGQDKVVTIKFAVHSDDSRHRFSIETGGHMTKTLRFQYKLFLQCVAWAKRKFLIRPNIKKSFYGGVVSEYLSNFQFHGSLFIPISKFVLNIFGDLSGSGYPTDVYAVMERIRHCLRLNVGNSLGKFMMNYASQYVLRLYSMLPGMKGYDVYRNTRSNLIELGGIFNCHPIYLLLIGCRAHDILVLRDNIQNVSNMIALSKSIEDLDENSPSEIYNHFLPIPVMSIPDKGKIRHVRRLYNREDLAEDEKWMPLFLNDLDLTKSAKVAKHLLYSQSMAKSYSSVPEGLMYARIQQGSTRAGFRIDDKYYTFWEFVKRIEGSKADVVDIYEDLLRSSPTLLALMNFRHVSDIYLGPLSRIHVQSSQVNKINILNPGSEDFKYLKYALASMAGLDINYPTYIDEDRLDTECDLLAARMSKNQTLRDANLRQDFPLIYKYLNLRNAKPTYLHLNKYIVDTDKLDMYELISIIMKNYSPAVTGKVSIGKISSVFVTEKHFRPENITYKRDRDDEVHTAAKVLNLAKTYLNNEEYQHFKNDLKVAGKNMKVMCESHPFYSPNVGYYVDYYFICKEMDFKKRLSKEESIRIWDYDDDTVMVALGQNIAKINEYDITINEPVQNDNTLNRFISNCYYELYNLRSRSDWSASHITRSLTDIAPHLYYAYESASYSRPRLANQEGRIVMKTGTFNKYFRFLNLGKVDDDLIESEHTSDIFSWHAFTNADIKFKKRLLELPDKQLVELGYDMETDLLGIHSVGDMAKFNVGIECPDFQIMGESSRTLFRQKYYALDEMVTFRSGLRIPDVSRQNKYSPNKSIADLNKQDFERLRQFMTILADEYETDTFSGRKSLYYKENLEPDKDIYSYFNCSQFKPGHFKFLLSYNAFNVLCQYLQPVRCKVEHLKTLRSIKGAIINKYMPLLEDQKPTRYNLIGLMLHLSALIGVSQEVSESVMDSLTSTDYIEFVKFNSYAGCSAMVWVRIFESYMDKSDDADEELL